MVGQRERGEEDGKTRRAEEINRQIKRAIKIQRGENLGQNDYRTRKNA